MAQEGEVVPPPVEGGAPAPAKPVIDDSMLAIGPQTEDLKVLDDLIHGALEALLIEAKERGIDKPPYGRGPLHLPYDDYTREDDDEDDEDDDEEGEGDYDEDEDDDFEEDPPFKFEYGFNALSFLADYLRAHNPNNPDKDFEEEFEDDAEEGDVPEMDAATKLLS